MQTNAAVAEPMVEKMKKRNETSAADRIRSYLRHPGSGVLALLTIGAAVVTFAVLIFLVAYILVKGIPCLWHESERARFLWQCPRTLLCRHNSD